MISSEGESAYRGRDAVLVVACGDEVGLGLERRVGVGHRDAQPCRAEHTDVVQPVAEHHRIPDVYAELFAQRAQGRALVGGFGVYLYALPCVAP